MSCLIGFQKSKRKEGVYKYIISLISRFLNGYLKHWIRNQPAWSCYSNRALSQPASMCCDIKSRKRLWGFVIIVHLHAVSEWVHRYSWHELYRLREGRAYAIFNSSIFWFWNNPCYRQFGRLGSCLRKPEGLLREVTSNNVLFDSWFF